MKLSPQDKLEVTEFYWGTDTPVEEIRETYGLKKSIHLVADPWPSGEECEACNATPPEQGSWRYRGAEGESRAQISGQSRSMYWRSRSARDRDEQVCLECGHTNRSYCRCEHCSAEREREESYRQYRAQRQREAAYDEEMERLSNPEFVSTQIKTLNRTSRKFLRAFLEVAWERARKTAEAASRADPDNLPYEPGDFMCGLSLDEQHEDWLKVCEAANVVSRKRWLNLLAKAKLLFVQPYHSAEIVPNEALTLDMISIAPARKISKGLRFRVLQRDKHTCQYCGRKAPDVELALDHLVPVAKNGTDDYENLVVSCVECNSGKSDKLIESAHGKTREEWRGELARQLKEDMRTRRERLPEVRDHWARALGRISEYHDDAICRFMEDYDPDWIKEAVSLAVQRRKEGRAPSNYVKYVSGILKRMAEDGSAGSELGKNARLESLSATQKQIDYMVALADKLGIPEEEREEFTLPMTMRRAKEILDDLVDRRDSAPATEKQKSYVAALAEKRGVDLESLLPNGVVGLSHGDAVDLIRQLKAKVVD